MKVLFYYRGTENIAIESISAVLKEAGHKTDLIFDPGLDDTFYFKFPLFKKLKIEDKLVKKAKRFQPDLIAYGGVSNMYPYVNSIASRLKKDLDVPTIVGGVQASADPSGILDKEYFDMACKGEGEEAILELVDHLEKGKDHSKIQNLVIKKNGKYIENPIRPFIDNLDKLPFLDKDLFYKYGVFKHRLLTMMSRGCAFKCTFCINSMKGIPPLRYKSPKRALEELEYYKEKYNPKIIMFEDDLFPYNVKWLQEFVPEYKKRVDVPFYGNVHPLTVNEENIKLLAEAGCMNLSMGVQSGNEHIRIDIFERYGTNEQIKKAASIIKNNNIKLQTEFIFGNPEETPKEMWESVDLNYDLNPNSTASFILYPFPGTKLADYCEKNNLYEKEDLEKVKSGEGSYHMTSMLKSDYKDEAYKFNSLMPIFAAMPKSFKPIFKFLVNRKYGFFHKMSYYASIPFIYPVEFKNVLRNYPRLLYKSIKEVNN
ncbi:B12-binding domain-containing radical SAM protein [Candidatus Woesearchaeota archaeon]|nr:B12-binding domain-containing radical SAM protein [Candidatus Woesearchaeota archaeon]